MLRTLVPAGTARRVELLAGLLGLIVALLSSGWLAWWSGFHPLVSVFAAELALPCVIAGLGAFLHVRRGQVWGRYLIWVGAALALLESPSLLFLYPFALSLVLVVVAAIMSLHSLARPAEHAEQSDG